MFVLKLKRLNGVRFFLFFFRPPGINCLLTESDSGLFFLPPPNSSAVGVGFYGNSETNDGVYQLTYSLYNANHTLGSVENLVRRRWGGAVRRLVIGARICDVYGARNSRIPPGRGVEREIKSVTVVKI